MKSVARGHFKAGFDSVRSTKMRSFWTMLGVIIGVTSVITVVAIGEGVKQQISGQIHQMGNDLISIRPADLKGGGSSANNVLSGLTVTSQITSRDATIVKQTKGVAASAPLALVGGTARSDDGTAGTGSVIGTTSDLSGLLNQSIAYGAFLSDDDIGTNNAVIGKNAAEQMFNEDVPLGRIINFQGRELIIIGVFNEFSSAPLSQQLDYNNSIFIPYDVAQQISKNTAPTYQVLARPSDSDKAAPVAKLINQNLEKAHGYQSNFNVTQGSQNLASSDYILNLLTRLIAGVAAISLLVGGIGIMNVMLVSVTERMHEIGIRKAVGATNRQILNQFIVESSLLSLGGGIIGVLLSFVIDGLLRLFTDMRPVISWQVVLLATGVSLAVGIIFGSVPALKAARKDPIDALRSE